MLEKCRKDIETQTKTLDTERRSHAEEIKKAVDLREQHLRTRLEQQAEDYMQQIAAYESQLAVLQEKQCSDAAADRDQLAVMQHKYETAVAEVANYKTRIAQLQVHITRLEDNTPTSAMNMLSGCAHYVGMAKTMDMTYRSESKL